MPERIRAQDLHDWLTGDQPPLVVDVRDDDRIGGHIKGSVNLPSRNFSRDVGQLREQTRDYKRVVFHCQLSQQRGPKCARIFAENVAEPGQDVYVLDQGFSGWARVFPDDEFTEGLVPELYY